VNHATRIASIRRAVILLALLASAAPAAYGQGVTLKYRWTKGESLTYRMGQQTATTVTGMPGISEVKLEQNMTIVLRITVEDVAADGTATLRQTFESVKMEMNGPMGRVSYDTAAPSSIANPMVQAMRQIFTGMVGASITIVQAADGSVRKVEGATKVMDQITKSAQSDPAAAAAAQGMKSILSDEAVQATLEQSFSKLPAAAVQPGETWQAQLAMGNETVGRVAGDVKFTLKAVEGAGEAAVAQIAVALTVTQDVAPPPAANGMIVKMGEGKGTGDIAFDVAKGRIVKSSMKTDTPSTMTMQGPDGNMATLQSKATTTMTMELVQK
jgi:Family of unknown function (DUF6263)